MPKIIVEKDADLVKAFNLPGKEIITIGSSSGCDVPLEDPSVASEQAKILLKEDGFHLQLVTHIPAVFVTDERVEGDVKLEDGDTISIEDFNLILNVLPDEIKVVEPPPPPPAPPPPEPAPPVKEEPIQEVIPEAKPVPAEKPAPAEPPPAPPEAAKQPARTDEPVKKSPPPPPPEPKPVPEPPKPEPPHKPEVVEKAVKEEVKHIKTKEIRIDTKPEPPPPPPSEPKPEPPPPPPPPEPKPVPPPEPKPKPKPEPPPPPPKPEPPPVEEKSPEPEPVKEKPARKPDRKTKVLPVADSVPSTSQPAGGMYLLGISGSLTGEKFKLKEGSNKIGRDRNKNDIVIREDSQGRIDKSISRQHAIIDYFDGNYFLSDKISQMRTKLNNKTISTSDSLRLKSGDIIEICSMKESAIFRFAEEGKFDFSPPGKSSGLNLGDKKLMPYLIIGAAVIVVIIILILLFK